MDRRSLGLAPTSRLTMRALLITACLFAAVPSAEAVSLPSISSSTGIAMAVVSVALALSLLIGMALRKKFGNVVTNVTNALRFKKKPAKQENVETGQPTEIAGTGTPTENAAARRSTEIGLQGNEETGQPTEIIPPQPIALVVDSPLPSPPTQRIWAPVDSPAPVATNPENMEKEFYDFTNDWNEHSLKEKEQFIVDMVKGFPGAVTPSMVMELLLTMLREEVNTDVWMRMLRFIMMLERHLFKWDRPKPSGNPLFPFMPDVPSQVHQRFQEFLIKQAENILYKYSTPKYFEDEKAGLMRFIAFLFGFVCKDNRFLELMDQTWAKFGFKQPDASRAMVWGYKNWKDTRVPGRTTDTESDDNNPNFEHFNNLMERLKAETPEARRRESRRRAALADEEPWRHDSTPALGEDTKVQHLLFALGCGYEPDWKEGPLAYMSDARHLTADDYLWLMNGRDLVAGNAWEWMCKEGMSEHDRMLHIFGHDDALDDGRLYKHIVDMVMKYEQDDYVKDGQCLMSYAMRMQTDFNINIDFGEHRDWYERFQRSKWSFGINLNEWLMRNIGHRPSQPCSLLSL